MTSVLVVLSIMMTLVTSVLVVLSIMMTLVTSVLVVLSIMVTLMTSVLVVLSIMMTLVTSVLVVSPVIMTTVMVETHHMTDYVPADVTQETGVSQGRVDTHLTVTTAWTSVICDLVVKLVTGVSVVTMATTQTQTLYLVHLAPGAKYTYVLSPRVTPLSTASPKSLFCK